MKYLRFMTMLLVAAVLTFAACDGDNGSGDGGNISSTITFDKQNGSGGTDSVTAIYGHAMPTATVPTRTGYTFNGYWDTTSGGTQYYNADMLSARKWDEVEDTILYARWVLDQYTITFEKQLGTGGSDSITVTFDSAMPLATEPTRGGFVFQGYWDATSGGNKYYNADMSSAGNWDKTANTTLYARWDWATYNLRDTGPAGGLIFYINPNAVADGWKYLECAPQSTEWIDKQWGKNGFLVNDTETAIGTGKNNTTRIIAKLNETPADSDRAAQLCDGLSSGGYDDWFLPSRDELYEICWVLHSRRWIHEGVGEDNPAYGSNRVGGFAGDYYWSSSEFTATNAWSPIFSLDEGIIYTKDNALRVRAIRAF